MLERLSFSFVRDSPAITITLTDPNGKIVTPTMQSGDYHQIYDFTNPVEGYWKIRRQGEGSVKFWVFRRYATVSVDMKAKYPYSGQSITVTARLMRSGTIITNTPSLSIEAQLVTPNHQVKTLSLNPADTRGVYTGIFTDTQVSGTYIASARVHLTDGELLNTQQLSATIVLLPAPPLPTAIPSPTIAETATMTPTGTSGGSGSNSGTPWLLPFLTVLGLTVGATATWRFKQAQEKARGLQKELANTVEKTEQAQQRAEQQIKDLQQELETPHLEVEVEKAVQQLNEKIDQAKDIIGKNPDKASTIASQVISSALNRENMIEENLSEPIGGALMILGEVAEKLLAPDSDILPLDDSKVEALKIGISQKAQKDSTFVVSVNDNLSIILRKLSLDKIRSQQITMENLKCIADNRIQWLHRLKKSDRNKINIPAIRAFGSIAALLQCLLSEEDSEKQAGLLKEVAEWFTNAHIEYADLPEWEQREQLNQVRQDLSPLRDETSFYTYLAELSARLLYPIKCPGLSKSFWKSIQMDPNENINLEQAFRDTFYPTSPLRENKDEMIKRINQFQALLANLREPERSVLAMICQRWISEVERLVQLPDEPVQVRLSLAPEIQYLRKTSENTLPFLIENLSSQPIWNVRLIITSEYPANEILEAQEGKQGYDLQINHDGKHRNYEIKLSSEYYIKPRSNISFEIRQKNRKPNKIKPHLEYETFAGVKTVCLDIGECSLVLRGRLLPPNPQGGVGGDPNLLNPFDFAQQGSARLEDDKTRNFKDIPSRKKARERFRQLIDAALDRNEGICINLYGVPRVGKTTLLEQIRLEVQDERDKFFPVRVDFLRDDGTQLIAGIFETIATWIRFELSVIYNKEEVKTTASLAWDITKTPLMELERYIQATLDYIHLQGDQKTVVLLIDNLNKFKRHQGQNEMYEEMLTSLASLINQKIILILTTEESFPVKGESYSLDKPLETLPLGFLSREDTEAITKKADPLEFSSLSLEYLFRITGGYPDAIQRICWYIFEDCKRSQMREVELLHMAKIVQAFFREWKDWDFTGKLCSRITENEYKILKNYIDKIEQRSLSFKIDADCKDVDTLLDLKNKEILIENGLNGYKLRIGFVIFLVDDWLTGSGPIPNAAAYDGIAGVSPAVL